MAEFKGRSSSSSSSSSSYGQSGGNMQVDFYYGNNTTTKNNWSDKRSYSLDTYHHHQQQQSQFQQNHTNNNVFDTQIPYKFDNKLKKSKTISTSSKVWYFSDPEFKRKKRVVRYRAYTVEGNVKRSFKKSFSWLKEKFIYGFW